MYTTSAAEKLIQENKLKRSQIKQTHRKKFYYMMILIILIFCIIQTARSLSLNFIKYITLSHQISKLKQLNATAEDQNAELKEQLKTYNSKKGIEDLARNNLKMVGENEVLVVVRKQK